MKLTDLKIFNSAECLHAVKGACRHAHFSKQIAFLAKCLITIGYHIIYHDTKLGL